MGREGSQCGHQPEWQELTGVPDQDAGDRVQPGWGSGVDEPPQDAGCDEAWNRAESDPPLGIPRVLALQPPDQPVRGCISVQHCVKPECDDEAQSKHGKSFSLAATGV